MGKATILSNLGDGLYEVSQDIGTGVDRTLQTWCVDYTDDATGEVATIEIPGEPKYTLIAPGARAHTAADGRTLARQAMTGPQAYFNAAILPGWQKFKPTYRRGTITAIDNNVATVALADDRSSAQNLAINQASTLSGVPIVYQDCNGDVFEVGDECVVEFQGQDWNNPKVIGFQSNPKVCGPYFVFAKYISIPPDVSPGPITPGPSAYFGTNGYYIWSARKWYSGGAVGQNANWIGSSGKTVSWKAGGDPFNYLYVVYKNRVIELSSIYEYQQFISAGMSYFNGHYWYDAYFGCADFQIAGAAVYQEIINDELHDVLYFVCAHRPSGVSIDYNYGPQNASTGDDIRKMYLYFYKKDLVTGEFTKLWEKSFLHSKLNYSLSPNYQNYGNSLTVLNDANWGPIYSSGTQYIEHIRYGYEFLVNGFLYNVSFHPSEIKAVCAVTENFQTGLLHITPNGYSFVANNAIAAQYHPEDGRLCRANITQYTRASTFTSSWTIQLSENFESFSYSYNNQLNGFLCDVNLCYPEKNVKFSYNLQTKILNRNFFNNQFNDTITNQIFAPDRCNFVLTSISQENKQILSKSSVRIVWAKEKYFCVFYSSTTSSIFNLNVPKLLSSEFTQEEFENDSGAFVSDVSSAGDTPMRIGYIEQP